jgi:curved DNA-binding protein CbpA
MNGTLTNQPLAELIREISSKALSGTLRLERDRVQTAVYFESGQLVYAASNLRTLRLREYLIKRQLISEKECANFSNNLSDLALAAELVAKQRVKPKEIELVLSALGGDVLRVALLWTTGTWEFSERARLNVAVRLKLDVANLLREAAQRMPLQFVSLRFRNPSEMIVRAAEVSSSTNFLPAESFLLSRLDRPTKLEDLVSLSGLRELDAHRVIYGLALSGLVSREYWQNAFRTESSKPNVEQSAARPAPGTPSVPSVQAESRWVSVSDEEADLEIFLKRMRNASNYYEVIELPTTAKSNEIKDAYYALARRYHPDRFHVKSGTRLHSEISSAFARVTQAYETLTDPNARAAYDESLERSRRFAESTQKAKAEATAKATAGLDLELDETASPEDRAEYNFREGFGALQQGRVSAAVTHLSAAARLIPDEARYRAQYGRALAAQEQTRRLAENEIQAAVKLEPANPSFRILLAELYFDLKFHRRAQTELDRALAIEPDNAQARSLLRKLEKSRKVG